jgi:hypothetical protein
VLKYDGPVKILAISPNVRAKILAVYFPDDFIHIYSSQQLDKILRSIGAKVDEIGTELVSKWHTLLEIKHRHRTMKDWSNLDFSHFMRASVIARSRKSSLKDETAVQEESQYPDVDGSSELLLALMCSSCSAVSFIGIDK